jgi:DNA repair exonuclease SbcCD nuclease subunit
MAKKIQTIGKIARRKNADIIQVGDLFDSSKNSNFFMAWVIKQLRDNIKGMSVVPGNHDLPGNTMKNFSRSPLSILLEAGIIDVTPEGVSHYQTEINQITTVPFGELENLATTSMPSTTKRKFLCAHHPVYTKVPFYHEKVAWDVKKVREKLSAYDYVIFGDIHAPFMDNKAKPVVLNCGSIFRLTKAQIRYHPSVWLWEYHSDSIEEIILPITALDVQEEDEKIKQENDQALMEFVQYFNEEHRGDSVPEPQMVLEEYLAKNHNNDISLKNAIQEIQLMEEV